MKKTRPAIERFAAWLTAAQLDPSAEDVADMLWLLRQMGSEVASEVDSEETEKNRKDETQVVVKTIYEEDTSKPKEPQPKIDLFPVEASPPQPTSQRAGGGVPFNAPAARAIRSRLELARALRPLMRKVPSSQRSLLDEEATVASIVESELAGSDIWMPVVVPDRERWLDLDLVVEDFPIATLWQETIAELEHLVMYQGAFRTVRTWSLREMAGDEVGLFAGWRRQRGETSSKQSAAAHPIKELIDPTGRRLVLLVSDCSSSLWRKQGIYRALRAWTKQQPVAIAQLLPERLWSNSALGYGFPVQVTALDPGVANHRLVALGLPAWADVQAATQLTLPIITIDPAWVYSWAQMVAGSGEVRSPGIVFDRSFGMGKAPPMPTEKASEHGAEISAEELVQHFRVTASLTARKLAGMMAAMPVSVPVINLVRASLLPEAQQGHVAEVLMSGLVEPQPPQNDKNGKNSKNGKVYYDFVEGTRDLLIRSASIPTVERVLEKVSEYVAERAGVSIRSFASLLMPMSWTDEAQGAEVLPFAQLAAWVLQRMGGEYAAWVEQQLHTQPPPLPLPGYSPPFLECEFEVATVRFSSPEEVAAAEGLQPFSFEVARIDGIETVVVRQGIFGLGRKTEEQVTIRRRQERGWQFIEALGNGVELEMVSIPGGTFLMGSPKGELERSGDESPQHEVAVSRFLLGKYPVTQAQWRAVAAMPRVNRDLNPDPSRFKGDKRPVEQVSWEDTVEFCQRLSQHTGRTYRLPSEAEWEYACRAGTTTPFHFGETITTDLANYCGQDRTISGNLYKGSYGDGPKGEYREQTTPVGMFPPNAFGLCDMHGNVWEWCMDDYHDSYEGAPTDGSAWLDRGRNLIDESPSSDEENSDREQNSTTKVLRGGSWYNPPWDCRSAFRIHDQPVNRDHYRGFRVCCVPPRILP